MCCELCPEFEECEHYFEWPEYCCPKCPEYDDCPIRMDVDYTDFGREEDSDDSDF